MCSTLKSFFDYQHQLEEEIRRTHGLPAVLPSVTAWTKAMLQPFTSAFGHRSESAKVPGIPEPLPSKEDQLEGQLKALEKQVAELKRSRKTKVRKRRRKTGK